MDNIDIRDMQQKAYERINSFQNLSTDRISSMKETIKVQDTVKEIQNKLDTFIQENSTAAHNNVTNSSSQPSSFPAVFKWIVILIIAILIIYFLSGLFNGSSFSLFGSN